MIEEGRVCAAGACMTSVTAVVALLLLLWDGAHLAHAVSVSMPGGAGHALLFRDHMVVKKDFKDFPSRALTFEAWISSSDFCHAGTIMSYAKDSKSSDEIQRIKDFNHFVIFDMRNLLACHDFQYMDLQPDPNSISCHASFRNTSKSDSTATFTERDGTWHHLAVTWTADNAGLTNIYFDGLLMSSAYTHKTEPLVPNGALILGGEQDCFGGCTDASQSYYGLMDEVRIWKTARSQDDIMKHMRWASGLENSRDLVAYWKFNEPDNDNGQFAHHLIAKDSSGRGNDLVLSNEPVRMDARLMLPQWGELRSGLLQFRNNYAINRMVQSFPEKSFTVELWARGNAIAYAGRHANTQQSAQNIFSYATYSAATEGRTTERFLDDAIRIERIARETTIWDWDYDESTITDSSTSGALGVYINTNENTDNPVAETFMYFDTKWMDDQWHHIAVTWTFETGAMRAYFDGRAVVPFAKAEGGFGEEASVGAGGVTPTIVAGTTRRGDGALVLAQDQDCLGGCFSPANAWNGDLAEVRIWNRVRSEDEIQHSITKERPDGGSDGSLVAHYSFKSSGVVKAEGGGWLAMDQTGHQNHLELKGSSPLFVYSTAPLTSSDGKPVPMPQPGAGGYSLQLHDKQVLLRPSFLDFPSDALTLEFWMWSVDACRQGVPFSYAHGAYEKQDNAFLLMDYNSWGVAVMEDEGLLSDHQSGVSATDGNWHHVAVTWESSSGNIKLYDNGKLVWQVKRGQGKTIPSGGTLVVGREQDCLGGCFDSAAGAVGKTSSVANQEYGPQDFFGVIEEMRLWRVVRSADQIRAGMDADDGKGLGGFNNPGVDVNTPGLVAYWRFDEGNGFMVKDATGHGHDLLMAEKPDWVVTRWLSTCGNGIVEGLEECDDGKLADGDGCSASCKVEAGYVCTGNPSQCAKTGQPLPPSQPDAPSAPASGRGAHDESVPGAPPRPAPPGRTPTQKRMRKAGIAFAFIIPILGVLGCLLVFRRQLPRSLPALEAQVASATNALAYLRLPFLPRGGAEYNPIMTTDMEDSPEFLHAAPPRHSPPGSRGHYQAFADVRQSPAGSRPEV